MKSYFYLLFNSILIGIAEMIPGISGGTVAFVTGIYPRLLRVLYSFNQTAWKLLIKGAWKRLWSHLDVEFLCIVVFGLVISVVTTAKGVKYALASFPIQLWSCCIGMVMVSAIAILRRIRKWNISLIFIIVLGICISFWITQLCPGNTPEDHWFIALSGIISVFAMLLPGISGSFVLVLLGKYTFMLNALYTFKWDLIFVFFLSGAIGLFLSARLVFNLLRYYNDVTLVFLSGFMVGSLSKVWPWKQSIHINSIDGSYILDKNISPLAFQKIYEQDPLVLHAILWFALGVLVIVLVEQIVVHEEKNINKDFLQ